jgi:integrase
MSVWGGESSYNQLVKILAQLSTNKDATLYMPVRLSRALEDIDLEWTNIVPKAGTISVTQKKAATPRIFKISSKLLTMLPSFERTSVKIFSYKDKFYLAKTFRKMRKRIAHKLGNPRIPKIHFHTFRHWKTTMEYHKTKDILHVMHLLGHKSIINTLIYTQLISILDDDYACKATKTLEEATQLIEGGFEYVTEVDGCKLFRKRK